MIEIGVLLATLWGVIGLFLWRNHAVYAFRTHLIDEVHDLYTVEIHKVYELRLEGDRAAQYPSNWRWTEFDSISYLRMVWQPWRALGSFYREGFPAVEPKP